MPSDTPVDYQPLDARVIVCMRFKVITNNYSSHEYLYDFFSAMSLVYESLFPLHLNKVVKDKGTLLEFIGRKKASDVLATVQAAIQLGNLQSVRDLAFYKVPPPLFISWLPGQPDLNVVWEQASKGEWLQTLPDSNGDDFDILHPSLGLHGAYGTPIVVLEEYEEMWEALGFMSKRQQMPPSRLYFVGHAGIGKTLFLQYAMARACSERLPFIVASTLGLEIVYFDGKNYPRVIEHNKLGRRNFDQEPFILMDSHHAFQTPPPAFSTVQLCLATFACPDSQRWDWSRKFGFNRFFHVKLPTSKDLDRIVCAAKDAPKSNKPHLDLLHYIGPSIQELIAIRSIERAQRKYPQAALEVARNPSILQSDGAISPLATDRQCAEFQSIFFMVPPSELLPSDDDVNEPLRLQPFFHARYIVPTLWQYQLLRDAVRAAQAEWTPGFSTKSLPFASVLVDQVVDENPTFSFP
ncbi:hypothetical protein ONZ45_g5900 [Pleurotus djamor]|nr:hypothetical protein ONZ45_g5900 [Pleurotus djamor]